MFVYNKLRALAGPGDGKHIGVQVDSHHSILAQHVGFSSR